MRTGEFLIHSKQVAYLAAAHADVASWDVHVGAYVAPQLKHEGLAETHDLGIALAAGREVAAALAAAHGQRGEGILEGLLKAQELEDRQVDRSMETKTALVGANGVVELHAVAQVGLHLALVVDPSHTEGENTVGLNHALHDFCLFKLRVLVVLVLNGDQHFTHCL